MTSKNRHGRLGRHARPSASLAEHHGNRLARERRGQRERRQTVFYGTFPGSSIANQGRELGGRQVAD